MSSTFQASARRFLAALTGLFVGSSLAAATALQPGAAMITETEGQERRFTVRAESGNKVEVLVERQAGEIAPRLRVLMPDGYEIIDQAGSERVRVVFTVFQEGEFTLVVSGGRGQVKVAANGFTGQPDRTLSTDEEDRWADHDEGIQWERFEDHIELAFHRFDS